MTVSNLTIPNIFSLATKELSQDAFIAWLLEWADPACFDEDNNLHKCAQAFAKLLVDEKEDFVISKIKVGRQGQGSQLKNIDIWAEINDRILLVIEDKKHSEEHNNQLVRYKENAEKWCANKEGKWNAKFVYLKTGDESKKSLNIIQNKGYKIINRESMIDIFNKFTDIHNNIFLDFKSYITMQENNIASFKNIKSTDWQDGQWIGLYRWLQDENDAFAKDWFWVNNMSGGFWGFLLNWDWKLGDDKFKNRYPIYSQIESDKAQLCIKISLSPDDVGMDTSAGQKSDIRNNYYDQLINKAQENGIKYIRRPNRFGNGKYMTIAVVNRADWLIENDNGIDMENTLKRLETYHSFIQDCTATWVETSSI